MKRPLWCMAVAQMAVAWGACNGSEDNGPGDVANKADVADTAAVDATADGAHDVPADTSPNTGCDLGGQDCPTGMKCTDNGRGTPTS